MIQINGNLLAEKVLKKARKEIQDEGLSPSLAIIFIGTDSGSAVYIKKKQEAGEKIGVRVVVYQFDSATTEEICTLTGKLALDSKVSGIILQLPAPGIDINKVFALIPPEKDVDGLNPLSLGKLWQGGYEQGQKYMIPATPAAKPAHIDLAIA